MIEEQIYPQHPAPVVIPPTPVPQPPPYAKLLFSFRNIVISLFGNVMIIMHAELTH